MVPERSVTNSTDRPGSAGSSFSEFEFLLIVFSHIINSLLTELVWSVQEDSGLEPLGEVHTSEKKNETSILCGPLAQSITHIYIYILHICAFFKVKSVLFSVIDVPVLSEMKSRFRFEATNAAMAHHMPCHALMFHIQLDSPVQSVYGLRTTSVVFFT